MTYNQRRLLLILIDSLIVILSIFISRTLVYGNVDIPNYPILLSGCALLTSRHFFGYLYKLYNRAWEYASVGELTSLFKSITWSIVVTAIIQFLLIDHIFVRLLFVTWFVHMILIGGSRLVWRVYRDTYMNKNLNKKRTLIIGAGAAGTMVVRQLMQNRESELLPVAFVDDDIKKQRLNIMGIPVLGGVPAIVHLVNELSIENIVIAIPSLSKKELNLIFNECAKTKAETKILPMLEDLMTGKVSVSEMRDVQVEDLLGREPVELDMFSISESITGRVILVTGAGGSIGSEICRQITPFTPSKLVLLGHGENSIYTIEMELRPKYGQTIEIVTEIADVQDRQKIFSIMEKHRPDMVYHAAAHKHVPLMERNPEEAVKNNIVGTKNVAEAASIAGVKTFVMVSTDKAVNPTNVMGATKRLAEMLIQNLDSTSATRFVAVRFGNVLGSRGSVIPLFKKQIKAGGPVTVTHPDMIRYFMTIPEASRLVIQAGALAKGGEIFVLDMGEPVKIVDLAKNLIKLSGYSLDDISIEFTGIRPGEKMFEELLNKDEIHEKQVYPKIYIGKTANLYIEEIEEVISTLSVTDSMKLRDNLLALANHKVVSREVVTS